MMKIVSVVAGLTIVLAGAWAQQKLEPVVPDAIDEGNEPFIKPFMVRLADDHYALDVRRARELLGWEPRHRLKDDLPKMVRAVKDDPAAWYERNEIDPPDWIATADSLGHDTGALALRHGALLRRELRANRWAHFASFGLGTWLVTQPALIAIPEPGLRTAEIGLGTAVCVFAALSLSWRMQWARWVCAPYRASAGTRSSPMLSFSKRYSAMTMRLRGCRY